jgi:hypothetical protein
METHEKFLVAAAVVGGLAMLIPQDPSPSSFSSNSNAPSIPRVSRDEIEDCVQRTWRDAKALAPATTREMESTCLMMLQSWKESEPPPKR